MNSKFIGVFYLIPDFVFSSPSHETYVERMIGKLSLSPNLQKVDGHGGSERDFLTLFVIDTWLISLYWLFYVTV